MKRPNMLVPTDFSEFSLKAFEAAASLSHLLGGSITPFHAYLPVSEMDSFYYSGVGLSGHIDYDKVETSIKERLQETASKLVAGKTLKPGRVGIGNPAYAITEAAKEYDLVVMTSHGRTGFSRLLLGSISEKVLRMSHTPVLVVGHDTPLVPINKILVTTDMSSYSTAAFKHAKEWAALTGAQIDLLHVLLTEDYDSEAALYADMRLIEADMKTLIDKHFGESIPVNAVVMATDGSVHAAIVKRQEDEAYNLIVMATVGRTGLEYLMMGSTASHVVRHVKTSLLSINPDR
jgi:nucleotide-binding universal stress UspA family protein